MAQATRSHHEAVARALATVVGAVAAVEGLLATEQAIHAEPDLVEEELTGPRGHQAHLLERLALGEARIALLEDEGKDLPVTDRRAVALIELGVDHGHVRVRPVRRERLRAGQDELVPVATHRRLHPTERIRARVRLGDRPRRDVLERGDPLDVLLLLLQRALLQDRRGSEADRHTERHHGAERDAGQLRSHDRAHAEHVEHRIGLARAVLLGRPGLAGRPCLRLATLGGEQLADRVPRHVGGTEVREELASQVVRRELAGLDLVADRLDVLGYPVADALTDRLVHVGPCIHRLLLSPGAERGQRRPTDRRTRSSRLRASPPSPG